MNLNQIDEAAYSGVDIMPKLMDDIDRIYYIAMRSMYESYRVGAITQDEAKTRKQTLRNIHGRFDINRKIYRQHQQIERSLGGYHRELETCGCEHCKKLIQLIDGREIPE